MKKNNKIKLAWSFKMSVLSLFFPLVITNNLISKSVSDTTQIVARDLIHIKWNITKKTFRVQLLSSLRLGCFRSNVTKLIKDISTATHTIIRIRCTPYNQLSGHQMLSGTQIISTSHGMTCRNFFDVFLPFYLLFGF